MCATGGPADTRRVGNVHTVELGVIASEQFVAALSELVSTVLPSIAYVSFS